MKIAQVEVIPIRAPRKEAVRSGRGTEPVTASEFGIVRLVADSGVEGVGEISITAPRVGFSLCHAARRLIAPRLIGLDPLRHPEVLRVVDGALAGELSAPYLRAAFEKHYDETEGQVERLEQIFEMIGKAARGKKCEAIEGIIDEGKEVMEEYADTPALDAGLLSAAQSVEHYEIARYGTLKSWAEKLNMPQAVKLLDATPAEEKKTDETLTKIAEKAVNYEAAA